MGAVRSLQMKIWSLQEAQFHCHQNVDHIKVRMASLLKTLCYNMICYDTKLPTKVKCIFTGQYICHWPYKTSNNDCYSHKLVTSFIIVLINGLHKIYT